MKARIFRLLMRIFILEMTYANVLYAKTLPIVQRGLFVISGVATCGESSGYCLMGNDCTVNEDFLPDPTGHCSGLRTAFIPETHFSCCRYASNNSTFDGLDAVLPPTSTLDEDINQTATNTPESTNRTIDSTVLENNFSGNGPRDETQIQDAIDENRMSRKQAENAEQIDLNNLPAKSQESHSEPIKSENSPCSEILSETDYELEYDCIGIPQNVSTEEKNVTDDNLKFPETGFIKLSSSNESDEQTDSVHSLLQMGSTEEAELHQLHSEETKDASSETSGLEDSEIFSSEDVQGSSQTRDLNAILDTEEERKIDINHLGCAEDIHTNSDLSSTLFENVESIGNLDRDESLSTRDIIYANDIDDHNRANSPVQWFHMARSLIKDIEKNFYNTNGQGEPNAFTRDKLNRDDVEVFAKLTVPEELRGYSFLPKEKFPHEKCLNFPNTEDDIPRCMNAWKFIANNRIICFGYLINSIWILTSASCITKIYDNQMDAVLVTDVEEKNGLYGISNMIVNENYKAEEQQELNDIGLVSLNRVTNCSCFVCLSTEEKKYANKTCSTFSLTTNENNQDSLDKCQGRLKALNIHSKLYLSLSCPTNENATQKIKTDSSSANALWCENVLVGIETTYDNGVFKFTSVYEYADWVLQNIQLYL